MVLTSWSVQHNDGDVVEVRSGRTEEGMDEDPLHSVVHSADLLGQAAVVSSQSDQVQLPGDVRRGDTVRSRQH